MRLLTILITFLSFQSFAQNEFAPLGAEWKYTYHRFVQDYPYNCEYNICDQNFGSLNVIDTTTIEGRDVSILSQGVNSEPIYIHSRNDSVFFYAVGAFHLLYDFTAEDGDTIDISVPTYYTGPGSLNAGYSGIEDSVIQIQVLVSEAYSSPILINNEERKVFNYEGIDHDLHIQIPRIIEGIGSGSAFLGHNGAFVADGCYGFFICYQDDNQSYTPYGCCEYPEDFPERTVAPLGAEWLYEGWSGGAPNTSGCIDYCEGNYNLFKVEDEKDFGGRVHAVINRYHKTKSTEWVATGDKIYMYNYDQGFYAHSGFEQFTSTYRTDVEIGDTIRSSAVQSYPKWIGNDSDTYPFPTIGGDQVVENVELIDVDGQMRKRITFRSVDQFRIGMVIEGIGPLFDGLLGYDLGIPASGCPPRLICYRDNQITYATDDDCGCEFPMGPNAVIDLDASSITIAPNPTYDIIKIENSSSLTFDQLELMDLTGRSILKSKYQNTLDVQNLDQGVYMLVISNDDGRLVKKVVKN